MRADVAITRERSPLLAVLLASLVLHALVAPLVARWIAAQTAEFGPPVTVRMIDGDALDALTPEQAERLLALEAILPTPAEPAESPEEDAPPDEPDPVVMPKGQVVEVPRPREERVPVVAEYLAEFDSSVPVETRTDRVKVNPDVLSNRYSEESRLALEDVVDVGATEMSTGATPGSLALPTPGMGAPRSAVASPWAFTNKEGLAAPIPASSRDQELAGAPQNDLLREKRGDAVALNTREFIGSAYINRIKRQVNLYWSQNLDNLSPSVRLSRPRYQTVVDIVLTNAGALESVTVTDASGSTALDECVLSAFRLAGPFPNPPAQLIARDGRVYLSDLAFEVQLGRAQMQYQGIDPRAGVQFPGIMKSPR